MKKLPWGKIGKGASIAGAILTGLGAVIKVVINKDEVSMVLEKIISINAGK